MKHLSDIASDFLQELQDPDDHNRIVEFICTDECEVYKMIEPTRAAELSCPGCGGSVFVTIAHKIDSSKRLWLCNSHGCPSLRMKPKKYDNSVVNDTKSRWLHICDRFNLGDLSHDVTFEGIEQTPGKIEYLRKFSKNPSGLIYMYGNPGTGKSYSCMATLELYSRNRSGHLFDSTFCTHRGMFEEWMASNSNPASEYKKKIENVEFLIIDDFGTVEPSPSFMAFFMGLIDTRSKFSKRGTIINTNLSTEDLNRICGDALVSRIISGQNMDFAGKDRRKKRVL